MRAGINVPTLLANKVKCANKRPNIVGEHFIYLLDVWMKRRCVRKPAECSDDVGRNKYLAKVKTVIRKQNFG